MLGKVRVRPASALLVAVLMTVAAIPLACADAVDNYIGAKMKEKSIPGLALAVIKDGRVIKERAYGYASLELKVPVTLQTSFPWASTTKIFTAVALMQMVEQGKIALDQPVSTIVTGLPAGWSKVTIRHCLSHTTGLPYAVADQFNINVLDGDRDQLIARLADKPVFEPGTRIDYNATDFVLLTLVIEKISGLSYEEYLQRFVLDPAGVKTARFGDSWAIIPGRADLYTALDITADHKWLAVHDDKPVMLKTGVLRYGQKSWPDYMQSQAGLNGSIQDLVAWEAALSGGKLIKAESLAQMEQPYRMASGKDGFFGLAFTTHPYAGAGSVSYGGGAQGWRVKIPSQHLVVIVLTNLQGVEPERFISDIAAFYTRK